MQLDELCATPFATPFAAASASTAAAAAAASAASTAAAAAAAASAAAAAAAAGSASAAGGGNVHLSGQLAECVLKFNEQVDKRALVGIVTGHGNERGVAGVSNKTILMKSGIHAH